MDRTKKIILIFTAALGVAVILFLSLFLWVLLDPPIYNAADLGLPSKIVGAKAVRAEFYVDHPDPFVFENEDDLREIVSNLEQTVFIPLLPTPLKVWAGFK